MRTSNAVQNFARDFAMQNWTGVRSKIYAGLLFGFALSMPLQGQAQTLQEAALLAIQSDPGIAALRHEVARREVDIATVRDERLPQVNISAEAERDSGLGINLTISQVLYDWGRVKSRVEAASSEKRIALADLKGGTENLLLELADYFIDIEIYDNKLAEVQSYLNLTQRIARQAEDRANAGRGTLGEVARARLEVQRTIERHDQLSRDREMARLQLDFLSGGAVQRPQRAPTLNFARLYNTPSAITAAVVLTPEYMIAEAGVTQAGAQQGIARAARLPSVRLEASVRADLERGNTRSSVGISSGTEVGMSRIRGREVEAARLQREAAEANLLAVQRSLTNKVRNSLAKISALSASEEAQRAQLTQAATVLENYEQQFMAGQRELLDLLTTARDLFDAKLERIEVSAERKRSEYEAAHDLGVLGSLITPTGG